VSFHRFTNGNRLACSTAHASNSLRTRRVLPVLRSRILKGAIVIEPTMTCRIDRRVIEEDLVILHLSGQITEQDTDTLRASVEQNSNVVALDLGDILIVDREAIKLLALCQSNGLELRNCPAYIREWVTRERKSE